jgi:4-amino-4-deoxy-L-arabinose transferase-like glycosyltransferase
MLGILLMVWHLAKQRHNKDFALLSMAILFSLPLFYIAAGTVMTDPSLAFCVFGIFTTFWLGMHETVSRNQKIFNSLFFASISLGLLAKGPICLVLSLPPIIIWQAQQKNWSIFLNYILSVRGILITLLIALPWYIIAESHTPGFLNYFIIGEHFGRFLIPGWSGDRYGFAHHEPIGMIWIYIIVSILPWSLIIIYWILKNLTQLKTVLKNNYKNLSDPWLNYLLCWTLWPLIFFTLAQNVIIPYVITVLPPLTLLILEFWYRYNYINLEKTNTKKILLTALLAPITVIFLTFWFVTATPNLNKINAAKTQKHLAQEYLKLRASENSQLYYYSQRKYSAEFYSRGQVKFTTDINELKKLLTNDTKDFIAIKKYNLEQHQDLKDYFDVIGRYGYYLLLEEKAVTDT